MRYELTDNEWSAIKPMLPNKPRRMPRVNDRRVLNGIFWVLRSGAPSKSRSKLCLCITAHFETLGSVNIMGECPLAVVGRLQRQCPYLCAPSESRLRAPG
jgi:hypothetical protein